MIIARIMLVVLPLIPIVVLYATMGLSVEIFLISIIVTLLLLAIPVSYLRRVRREERLKYDRDKDQEIKFRE
jgi:hypothetical protein